MRAHAPSARMPADPHLRATLAANACAFIGDTMWAAEIHAQQAQRYAQLGDLAGLAYATRCLADHCRTSLAVLGDLREQVGAPAPGRAEKRFATPEAV